MGIVDFKYVGRVYGNTLISVAAWKKNGIMFFAHYGPKKLLEIWDAVLIMYFILQIHMINYDH